MVQIIYHICISIDTRTHKTEQIFRTCQLPAPVASLILRDGVTGAVGALRTRAKVVQITQQHVHQAEAKAQPTHFTKTSEYSNARREEEKECKE